MWWRNRSVRGLAAGLALLAAACGFEPLYAERTGGAAEELRSVQVSIIPDRPGQILRNELQILFNPRGSRAPETYGLTVDLESQKTDATIRRDETVSRTELTVVADYVLTSLEDRRVLTRGRARSVNSFDIVASDFANAVAEQDALERNLNQLARSIQTQLALYFKRHAQAADKAVPRS